MHTVPAAAPGSSPGTMTEYQVRPSVTSSTMRPSFRFSPLRRRGPPSSAIIRGSVWRFSYSVRSSMVMSRSLTVSPGVRARAVSSTYSTRRLRRRRSPLRIPPRAAHTWAGGAPPGWARRARASRSAGSMVRSPQRRSRTSSNPAFAAVATTLSALASWLVRSPQTRSCANPAATSPRDLGIPSTVTSDIESTPPGRSTRWASARNLAREGKWNAASMLITPSNEASANGRRTASARTGCAPAASRRRRPVRSWYPDRFTATRRPGLHTLAITRSCAPSPLATSRTSPLPEKAKDVPDVGGGQSEHRLPRTLDHHHRDLPLDPGLVSVVLRPDRRHGAPQTRTLPRRGGPGARVEAFGSRLDVDLRIGPEVQVPGGVAPGPARRAHHEVPVAVAPVDQRRSAQLPRLPTPGGEEERVHPAPPVSLPPLGLHVLADVTANPVAGTLVDLLRRHRAPDPTSGGVARWPPMGRDRAWRRNVPIWRTKASPTTAAGPAAIPRSDRFPRPRSPRRTGPRPRSSARRLRSKSGSRRRRPKTIASAGSVSSPRPPPDPSTTRRISSPMRPRRRRAPRPRSKPFGLTRRRPEARRGPTTTSTSSAGSLRPRVADASDDQPTIERNSESGPVTPFRRGPPPLSARARGGGPGRPA